MAIRKSPSTSAFLARNRRSKAAKGDRKSARAAAKDAFQNARKQFAEATKLRRQYEKEARKGTKADRRVMRRLLDQRYRRMSAIERLVGVYKPRSSRLTAWRKASIRRAWARTEKLLARSTKKKRKSAASRKVTNGPAGKSRSVHPTSPRIRIPSTLDQRKLQVALKALRAGKSLSAAAHEANLPPTTLRRLLEQTGLAGKRGRTWIVRDDTPRQLLVYSDGQALVITVPSLKAATVVGAYMSHVGQFLKSNDPDFLGAFSGGGIEDIEGTWHTFETDPDMLYRLASTGSETFEQVYRIVI